MANSVEFEHCFAQLACDLGICSPKSILYGLQQKNDPESTFFGGDLDVILQETGMINAAQCRDIKMHAIGLLGEVPHIEGFELDQMLNIRGFSRLYRARQVSVDREVFIKVINVPTQEDSPALARFRAEAKILAQLNHHNICGAIDMGETADCMYLVLQSPDGVLASDLLLKRKPLGRQQLRVALDSLLHLLQHIHKNRVVHGNINPENIIIHPDGSCSLTGFEYAISNSVEQNTLPVWPVEFPAPAGLSRVQADYYACGASLWLLAGGQLHPSTENDGLKFSGFGATMRTFAGVKAIISQMLRPTREDNYSKAADIIRDIKDVEGGSPPEIAYAGSKSLMTFKAGKKKSWLAPVACLAGLACGAFVSYYASTRLQAADTENKTDLTAETEEVFMLSEKTAALPRWETEPNTENVKDSSKDSGEMWKKIITTPPGSRKRDIEEFLLKYPNAPQEKIARSLLGHEQ